MQYVELKRSFAPIEKNQEPAFEIARLWGRKLSGWLDWPELLKRQRVVLLAEALSGKTWEFRHQAETLLAQGKAAFFARIEDLADDSFDNALEPPAFRAFERWRDDGSAAEGWFFLDSVDEARLRSKSLDKALRNFVHGVGSGLDRAHIFVSCRVSDWEGDNDRAAIERLLPLREKPTAPVPTMGKDEALFAPIFSKRQQTVTRPVTKPAGEQSALLVVQLVPLDYQQQLKLASETGIDHPKEFVDQIEKNGLEALADRPGDVLDLIEYWKEKKHFGSLAEMTEFGVDAKLRESNTHRPDSGCLSSDKARQGAERLAAVLTLGKSFSIRAPGHKFEPNLAAGAIDPAAALPGWTPAEQNTLLRRGLFAPSTYGRVRFHHRGTQEYLAAKWFSRLLRDGCPQQAVWDLFFAERYEVKTVVPSLRAVAAWFVVDHPGFREEVLCREPLMLVRDGDPHALPLEVKERLLFTYARRHAAGEISDDNIDRRAFRLFATPELADAIRKCWVINSRDDFRTDLLRLIREGAIRKCTDLAREIVLGAKGGYYLQTAGLQALDVCEDSKGLAAVARRLVAAPEKVDVRTGPEFAKILFPRYLSVDELLTLIGAVPEPGIEFRGGFGHVLHDLWRACPDATTREHILAGLADLALSQPFKDTYTRISEQYKELAKHLISLGRDAVLELGSAEPSDAVVRILMAIERAGGHEPYEQEGPSLAALVSGNESLKRRLFWADVEETRRNDGRERGRFDHYWRTCIHVGTLWQLGSEDLIWLTEDLAGRALEADKQVALSAIIRVLADTGRLQDEVPKLHMLVAGSDPLERYLNTLLAPPSEDEENRRRHSKIASHLKAQEQKQEREENAGKVFWLNFRKELEATPWVLCEPANMSNWQTGSLHLHRLTCWLEARSKKQYAEAALTWPLLSEGFSQPVAKAYRDGMKALWRLTPPEGPKHKSSGITFKWTTPLSLAGLKIEAAEDPDWTTHLKPTEVERAVLHACFSETEYPDWLDGLIEHHAQRVLPILRQSLLREWVGRTGNSAFLFPHFGWSKRPIPVSLQSLLLEIITGKTRGSDDRLGDAVKISAHLNVTEEQRCRLAKFARHRLTAAMSANVDKRVRHFLSMLFLAAPDLAVEELADWVARMPRATRKDHVESVLAELFGRHSEILATLDRVSVRALEKLTRFAYRHISPAEDQAHENRCVYTPNTRDHAEEARGNLLHALVNRPGAEAYQALRTLTTENVCRLRSIRFKELARGKAERDADLRVWSPAEVRAFEASRTAPVKTGEALLEVVLGVLSDIQSSPSRADVTSLPLLSGVNEEDKVQNWLGEQLELRSKGRYQVHREAQVANGNKPDLILSSTATEVEVAVEVKHSAKGWTIRELETALIHQLAGKYLKPETRRWGILVVTHAGSRTWRDPVTGKTLCFPELVERLDGLAKKTETNQYGAVLVRAVGLASPL